MLIIQIHVVVVKIIYNVSMGPSAVLGCDKGANYGLQITFFNFCESRPQLCSVHYEMFFWGVKLDFLMEF